MGLDISFNFNHAVKQGLKVVVLDPDLHDDGEPSALYMIVPTMGHLVYMTVYATNEKYPQVMGTVRANKWGATYAPLTKWLQNNNIKWEET